MIRASCRFILAAIVIYATAVDGADVVENLETIFLRLYIGTLNNYIDYSLDNISALQSKLIDDRPTVLYIHGFKENVDRESVRTIVQAYLKRNDHNTIALDYAKLANESYTKIVRNAPHIGAVVALIFDNMAQIGFNFEKLHIIGHSMGSQIAGYIGRKVSFQIPRITGLDPAGPLFNFLEPRLSISDARFVDIIHTDYGFYGIARSTGTVDFFPNGGHRIQPGCPQNFTFYSDDEFCSHHRSWEFYAESVNDERAFLGVQCPSSLRFFAGECNNHTRVIMGYGASKIASGNIYLTTATQSPFGLREKGAEVTIAV